MSKLGEVVHFVLGSGHNAGECRAALVVRDWTPYNNEGSVNLAVFMDGSDTPISVAVEEVSVAHNSSPGVRNSWHRLAECRRGGD